MSTIWQVIRSTGPEMGKEFPQVQETEGGYWNISDPRGVQNQLRNNHFPEGAPPFGAFRLHKKAKATDIVSTVMMSIRSRLVSPWCKSILETLNLGQHWFFPVSLITGSGEVLPYYVFHFNNDCSGSIDFSKSTFGLSKYSTEFFRMEDLGEKNFASREEYYSYLDDRKARKGITITPKVIVLDVSRMPEEDIFHFYRIGASVHVNERLKKALEGARITGWDYKESWAMPVTN